jgi:hypothetical protein
MLSRALNLVMSAIIKTGSETEVAAVPSARVSEPRVSRSVTAGMSDAEFEAWLVAQGAVPMSEERRAALKPSLSGVEA